jgi:hypothetical protein
MSNALFAIEIYRHAGTWCFTDEERGLIHEPFVSGIPELIDDCINQLKEHEEKRYRITFGEKQFPGSAEYLRFHFEEYEGAWYSKQMTDNQIDPNAKIGWLCPATLKFFLYFPKKIYFSITPTSSTHYEVQQ